MATRLVQPGFWRGPQASTETKLKSPHILSLFCCLLVRQKALASAHPFWGYTTFLIYPSVVGFYVNTILGMNFDKQLLPTW